MSGVHIPNPCDFLDTKESLGAFNGERRWRDKNGLFTWDFTHGEIEAFNKRGRHIGVFDCHGIVIKKARKGRRIHV